MYCKKYLTVTFILLSLSRKTSGTACPTTAGETWHLEATQCYVKVEQSKNFQDAEDWCQTQSGAHLVGIEEVDENTFLSSLLTVGGSSSIKYWIGLHKNSSQWVWLDGTNSTYDNWDMTSVPSEPDGSGDCVVMAGGSFWQDIDCSTVTNGFICETVGVCPSVPTFSHAAHNSTSVIVGSAVGYVCNPGYIFSAGVTSQISVCQDSGTWLPVIADCIEMNCTAPPAVSHASIQPYTSVIVGSIVTYDCDTGYQFSLGVESMSIACNESVLWNDTLPACSLKSCPTPQTIQRGSQGTTDGLVFSTLQYTCDIGYEFTNNETTMTVACNTSALWNETLSDCRIKDCVAVPVIANGWSWSNPSTTYGSSVRFGCNFGYTFSTGDYYFYTQCDNTKQWTPAVPACITIGCTTPPLVTDAYMNYTSTGLGDQVNYTCLAGYVFPDENTTKSAVCIGNGLWDPVVPSCEKKYVQCPSILPMSHVTVEGNGTIAYSQVTLTCDDGYRFPNDTNAVTGLKVQEIQCLYGQWNGTLMACQILSCGTVPVYNNMSVVASGQLYGDTATYTCQTNGTMFPDGSTERTVRCVDRGWSPSSLPNCQGTQTTVSVKAPVIVPVEAAVEVVVATATVPMALVGGMLGLMVFLDLATIGKHLAKMKENLMHFKYRLNNETPPVKKKKKKEEVAVVCKHCKEEGHKSRDCPICKYCKSTEHSHKDCYLLKTYCDNCGYHGHTPDECDDSDVERIKEEEEEEEEEYDDQKVKRKGKRKKSFDSGIIHDWAEWDGLMAVRDMSVACELPELPRDDFKFRRALSCPPRMKKITHQELMTTAMVVDTSFVPIPGPNDDYRPVFSPTERARNVQPAWQEYLRWDVDCQILTPAHTPLPEEIRVPTPVYRSVMTPTAVPHTLNTQRQNLDRTLFSSGDTPIPMDIAEMKIHKEIVSSPIKEVTVPLSQSVKEPPATEEVSVDLSEKLAPSATTRVHNMMFSPGETPVPQHMAEIILERKQSSPYLEGFPLQTMPEDDNLSTMTDSTIGIDEIEEELMKLAEDELEEMNRVCSQAKKSQISRHEQQNEKPQKEAGSSKETKNTATPSSVIFEDQKVRPLLSPSTSPVPPPRSKREIKSSAAKWTPADRDKPVFTPLADVDPSQTIKIKSIEQTIPETDEDKILEEKIAMSLAKHSSSPTYIKCQEQRQRQLMTPTISPVPPPRKKKDVKAALILEDRPLFTPLQMTDPSQAVSQSEFDTENIHGISDHNMEPISKPVTPTSQAVKEESIEQTIPETDEEKIFEEMRDMSLAKQSVSPAYIKSQEQRQRQLMTPTISPVPPPRKKKDVKAALILEDRPMFTPLQMTDPSQAISQSGCDTENIHGISDHNMEPISKADSPTSQLMSDQSRLQIMSPSISAIPMFVNNTDKKTEWRMIFGDRSLFTPFYEGNAGSIMGKNLETTRPEEGQAPQTPSTEDHVHATHTISDRDGAASDVSTREIHVAEKMPIAFSDYQKPLSPTTIAVNQQRARQVISPSTSPGPAPRAKKPSEWKTIFKDRQMFTPFHEPDRTQHITDDSVSDKEEFYDSNEGADKESFESVSPDLEAEKEHKEAVMARACLFSSMAMADDSQIKNRRLPTLPLGRPVASPTEQFNETSSFNTVNDNRIFTPTILQPDPLLMRSSINPLKCSADLDRCFTPLSEDVHTVYGTRLNLNQDRFITHSPEPERRPADSPPPSPVPEKPPPPTPDPFVNIDPFMLQEGMFTPIQVDNEATEVEDHARLQNVMTPFYDDALLIKPNDPRLRKNLPNFVQNLNFQTFTPTHSPEPCSDRQTYGPALSPTEYIEDGDRLSPVSDVSLPSFEDDDDEIFPSEYYNVPVFTPIGNEFPQPDKHPGNNRQLLTPMCALEPCQRIKPAEPITKMKDFQGKPMSPTEMVPDEQDQVTKGRPQLFTPLFAVDPTQHFKPGDRMTPEKDKPYNPLKNLVDRPISASETPYADPKVSVHHGYNSPVDDNQQRRPPDSPHEWPWEHSQRGLITPFDMPDPVQMIKNRGLQEWNMEKPPLRLSERYKTLISPDQFYPLPSNPEEKPSTPEVLMYPPHSHYENPLKEYMPTAISPSSSPVPQQKGTNAIQQHLELSPDNIPDSAQIVKERRADWPYMKESRPLFTPLGMPDPTQMIQNRGLVEWRMEESKPIDHQEHYVSMMTPEPFQSRNGTTTKPVEPEVYIPPYTPPPEKVLYTPPSSPKEERKVVEPSKARASKWLEKKKKEITDNNVKKTMWLQKMAKPKVDSLTSTPDTRPPGASPRIQMTTATPSATPEPGMASVNLYTGSNFLSPKSAKTLASTIEEEESGKGHKKKKKIKKKITKALLSVAMAEHSAEENGSVDATDTSSIKPKKKKKKKTLVSSVVDAAIASNIEEEKESAVENTAPEGYVTGDTLSVPNLDPAPNTEGEQTTHPDHTEQGPGTTADAVEVSVEDSKDSSQTLQLPSLSQANVHTDKIDQELPPVDGNQQSNENDSVLPQEIQNTSKKKRKSKKKSQTSSNQTEVESLPAEEASNSATFPNVEPSAANQQNLQPGHEKASGLVPESLNQEQDQPTQQANDLVTRQVPLAEVEIKDETVPKKKVSHKAENPTTEVNKPAADGSVSIDMSQVEEAVATEPIATGAGLVAVAAVAKIKKKKKKKKVQQSLPQDAEANIDNNADHGQEFAVNETTASLHIESETIPQDGNKKKKKRKKSVASSEVVASSEDTSGVTPGVTQPDVEGTDTAVKPKKKKIKKKAVSKNTDIQSDQPPSGDPADHQDQTADHTNNPQTPGPHTQHLHNNFLSDLDNAAQNVVTSPRRKKKKEAIDTPPQIQSVDGTPLGHYEDTSIV